MLKIKKTKRVITEPRPARAAPVGVEPIGVAPISTLEQKFVGKIIPRD